ncbi:hypothetical protein [Pseudarthrobacter phenanthrenivorans]|uniref:hypothetical protein n=1 Tax=Pseudarthrobacter phenanthrenivorans TaxID=361575 RepID=UPI002F357B07
MGGSLSVDDIIDIAGLNRVKLENTLKNCRIIRAADRHFPGRSTDSAFAFSHKTLPELTRSLLSRREILQAIGAILEAGMRHAQNAWSDETPTFFLWSSYPVFLASLDDLNPLIICVTDTARHKQLMRYPGGYSQIREELDISEVALSKRTPQLELYLRISIAKTATRLASKHISLIIPEVYSRMGDHQSALSLIAAMPYSSEKEDLTLKIVLSQIKSDDIALATDTVSMISSAGKRAIGLAALAEAQLIHGQYNAETLRDAFKSAVSVKGSLDASLALRQVIAVYSMRGEVPATVLDAALDAACTSGSGGIQELLELAKAYSGARIPSTKPLQRAYEIALSIEGPLTRFDALCDLAMAYAHAAQNIPPILEALTSSVSLLVPSRELLKKILGLAEALAADGLNVQQLLDCGRAIAQSNVDAKLRLYFELDIIEAESVCYGRTTVDPSVVNRFAQKSEDPALIMHTLAVLARVDFDIHPLLPALPELITREMTSEVRCALWVQLIKLAGPRHYLSKQALGQLDLLMRFGVSSASLVEMARVQYECDEDPEMSLRMAENQVLRSYSLNTIENLLAIGSICAELGIDSRPPMLKAWQEAKRWGFSKDKLLLVARAFAAAKMDAEAVLHDAAEIARDNAESLARIASCQLDLALDPTETLQRALKVARPQAIHNDDLTLYRLVCVEAEVSRISEATNIAGRISDLELQIPALKAILSASNQRHEDSQVLVEQLRIGTGLRSLTQRATLMSSVASTLADNQMDSAWALSEAQFAAYTSPFDARSECLTALAAAQLHCGKDPTRALADARRLVADPRSSNRALRLIEISRVELLAGLDPVATLDEAYKTAISDSGSAAVQLLTILCTAMVAAGMSSTAQFSKAKSRILELGGSTGHAKCLTKIYSEYVRRRLTEQSPFRGEQNCVQACQEATDAIVAVEDKLERISLLLELSVAVRESSKDAKMLLKQARTVASELEDGDSRFNALMLIAEQEIAAGMDPDWTLTRAGNEVAAHASLMKIAQLRARTGRLEEAMQDARAVPDKSLCVKVWSEVANVASSAQASIAREALTLALAEGSWVPVLEPLCKWEPSALEIIESSLLSTEAGE